MKKKRIAMLLAAALTFSQSMGAAIPVAGTDSRYRTGNCRDRRISSGERWLGNNRGNSFCV